MTDPHTRDEIVAALEARSRELLEAVAAIPDAAFMAGDTERWGPGQHLAHLTSAHVRLARALADPAALPELPAGESRDYAQMQGAYVAALAATPPALLARNSRTGATDGTRAEIVGRYEAASAQLREAARGWDEQALDGRGVPHPLLGVIRVREMLLFVRYHDLHHLEGIRRSIGG